ncbi:MAG TPA: hypothetical protein P5072_08195 [Parvularculaceae bacterium]|nr:hypothetical protein [Parvularculaceae bacterium]
MRRLPHIRNFLLAGSALGLLAACGEADVASPGTTDPVTVITNPGGGGGGATSFAARSSRPRSAADCPSGTEYDSAFVLADSTTTSICKIDSANGAVTGTVNVTYSADPIALIGAVNVGEGKGGSSGSLRFAAGQVIFGSGDADALFVQRGSKIYLEGSASNPIVLTSFDDLADDLLPNGSTNPQEWGGLVINGYAPINDCTVNTAATPGSADCEKDGEGSSGRFGGDDPHDNSGVLRYVRVQQAGILFNSTNELNGIAFQGVGDGTIVDYVQVHKNGDDGVEFFGGTVNVKHMVMTGNEDDSYDWTDGWTGNGQFLIAVQQNGVGNRGIEADNREGAADRSPPRSNPQLSNFTFVGLGTGGENDGIKLRRGTNATLINGIVANFGLDGLDFDQDSLLATPTVDSVLFAGNNPNIEASSATQAIFAAGANNEDRSGSSLTGIIPGPVEQGVTPTNPTSLGSFFTAANYVGAIDPATETATSNWTTGWTVGLGASTACPDGTIATGEAVPAGRSESRICRIVGPVVGEVTLTPGNLYTFVGTTFVGQDLGPDPLAPLSGSSGTLNISPGVTLFGDSGPDALVVSRGSKINVNGTESAPVIMTSRQDVEGGTVGSGQWGGLVINGRAKINDCTVDTLATPGTVDCEKDGEGSTGRFGGATDDDSSGRLNYLRVQYAGYLFNSTNELNGIAFQGVGSGTDVDYVQVHANADDGVEFFGGAVNAKHMIMTAAEDDSFDWTDGWTGKIQYAIAVQDPTVGNRGIEADNREGAADREPPRSNPTLANFTLFGRNAGGENQGVKLRRGTNGSFYNFIATNFIGAVVDYDADTVLVTPHFYTSLIIDTPLGPDAAAVSNNVFDAADGNVDKIATGRTMTAASGYTAALVPGVEEAITATTDLSTSVDAFFDDVDYVGAVKDTSDDWYKGWTLSGSL